jgi:hypothetical protein
VFINNSGGAVVFINKSSGAVVFITMVGQLCL